MKHLKYPIGIQSFEEIRNNGYIYVDKTKYIHRLVDTGKFYFLSRPRRFGKSLLLSTIEALFKGKRELFKGLAIDSLQWDWVEYPVLHLDLSGKNYNTEEQLDKRLNEYFSEEEAKYGYSLEGKDPDERFRTLIRKAAEVTGRNVVVLIDEYDVPMLRNINDPELRELFRQKLQAFYSSLKTMDPYIRFAMLSGVTRFGKVSIFSSLNNLQDISLDPAFNAICGVSEQELKLYFKDGISHMADSRHTTAEQIHSLLKNNFDGYHFAAIGEDIYNPFSLLNTLKTGIVENYWFKTGTPESLVRYLERSNYPLPELEGYKCDSDLLTGSDIYLKDPVPLLFQSGYLTIKGYDPEFKEYTLGFPNKEVSAGFSKDLMRSYMHDADQSSVINSIIRDVRAGKADDFMKRLQTFVAGIPYDHARGNYEAHWQNVMYVLFKLMGFHTHTEWRTSDGRIDMVVETPDYVYIMEFKVNSNAATAMKQINQKEYALPFRGSGKKIIKIGAAFSTKTRRLSNWKTEEEPTA